VTYTSGSFSNEDCLSLLCYASEHREPHTLTELAIGAKITRQTLSLILLNAISRGDDSRLKAVAEHYHFEFKVDPRALRTGAEGRGPHPPFFIIDVERRKYP